jgi:hypothetical protein
MASGVLAKNDPFDARMMASLVAVVPTRPAPRGRRRQPSGWSRCSAQRREGRRRECLETAGRCNAAAALAGSLARIERYKVWAGQRF